MRELRIRRRAENVCTSQGERGFVLPSSLCPLPFPKFSLLSEQSGDRLLCGFPKVLPHSAGGNGCEENAQHWGPLSQQEVVGEGLPSPGSCCRLSLRNRGVRQAGEEKERPGLYGDVWVWGMLSPFLHCSPHSLA